MRLDRLFIQNVRNLEEIEVAPAAGLNLFIGPNGAGKTALLEAVYLLARGRSFRSGRTSSLIRRGEESLAVAVRGDDPRWGRVSLSMERDLGGQTRLQINGSRERRLSMLAARLPLQLFLPDVSNLVFGSPMERRQWLDWGLFHVEPGYLALLQQCLQALRQRNAALRNSVVDESQLDVWTDAFCQAAEEVTQLRARYTADLEGRLRTVLPQLAPDLSVDLALSRGWRDDTPLDKLLSEQRAREVKLGATQSGPQRADLSLRYEDLPAASVLSRGQGKMLAMALKISQASLLSDSAASASLFLIDDVGAELDRQHGRRFYELLAETGCQIMASTTQDLDVIDGIGLEVRRFHVKQGRIEES